MQTTTKEPVRESLQGGHYIPNKFPTLRALEQQSPIFLSRNVRLLAAHHLNLYFIDRLSSSTDQV